MYIIILLLFCLLLLLLKKFHLFHNIYIKSFINILLFSIISSCILEVTIFNYRFYESFLFSNNEETLTNPKTSKNITYQDNNWMIEDNEEANIEFLNLNAVY